MEIAPYLEAVRTKKPLVHHLTNWVTIYDCAQAVKALGASPVMAHAIEEAADMTALASALVLNIGTLDLAMIASMQAAAAAANRRGIPVVLDVCGAGATPLRNNTVRELLNTIHIDIIKGNASEIASTAGKDVQTRGVDSGEVAADLVQIARELAQARRCTVVITGREDIAADSEMCYTVKNGCALMAQVVGTGCMAASVIGAFAGASPQNLTQAAAAGLACFGIAAELAVNRSTGPASFKTALLDCLYTLTRGQVQTMQKVTP